MPLVESFTASQSLGFPSRINFTDTSTGSDGAIAARRIYLVDSDGDYVVPDGTTTDYILWPYADASITVDVLLEDKALLVTVDWVNSVGATLYEATELMAFLLYAKTYYIYLIKAQSSNKKLIENANFYQNEIRLLCSMQEATNAIDLADDIMSAQAALSRAKELINNPSYFF